MNESSRRWRSQRAIERLETRWLFSLSVAAQPTRAEATSSHGGGCGCALCGGLSGFVQADSMVFLPPGKTYSDEELATLAASDHGAGCGCPLCQGAIAGSNTSGEETSGDGVSANFDNSGTKWPQPGGRGNPVTITYSLSNVLTADLGGSLSDDAIYDAIEEALGLWAKYAPLNFVEVVDSGPAVSDAGYSGFNRPNIRFGQHQEDGRNNVLAHAYYPDGSGLAGDVHLDTAENWTNSPAFNSIDIIEVLTHELGHSLGLGHEGANQAIMNAFYSGRYNGPGTGFLLTDDINGIRAIYGTGVGSVTPMERTPITGAESFTVEEDQAFASVASVLTNDSDPLGGALTAELVDSAAHGDVTLNADGTFQYTPDPNYFGDDTFTYLATNGLYASDPQTVTLAVRPALDLPIATSDTYTVRTGNSIATGRPTESVIAAGSSWKFLDDGSNQGTAWRESDFNDAAWSTGLAQLGYGDGDEATEISFGLDDTNKHITTYFRQEFDVADAERVMSLDMRMIRDDGAAVFLNGVPIARSNLAANATATTPALVDITGSSESRFFNFAINLVNLPAGTLREGRNVLAVEVHQSNGSSSDVSFDLSLALLRDVVADPTLNDTDIDRTGLVVDVLEGPQHGQLEVDSDGSLVYTPDFAFVGQEVITYRARSQQPATLVASGTLWRYLDNGDDLGILWQDPAFSDQDWELGGGQFGYGDGDEKTAVNFGLPNDRFATTYFRKDFAVADPSQVLNLSARVLRDDAAAIYLNGVEIYRDDNLPDDADHSVYTGDPVADENAFVTFSIPVELLVAGENVLAVEVHQSSATDTDLSFDFELTGDVVSESTTITIDVTPSVLGDVNFDGAVDLTDLNLVRNNFGSSTPGVLGDANGDGQINLTDLNAVRNNFGATAPAPAALSAGAPTAERFASIITTRAEPARSVTSKVAWDAGILELLNMGDGLVAPAWLAKRAPSAKRL